MICIVGKVFEKNLNAHDVDEILNTMPYPLAFDLADKKYDVYFYSGLPNGDVTEVIKEKMSDKRISFFTSEYEEGYDLDEFEVDSISDIVDGDVLVLFSNIDDDLIVSLADHGVEFCDCKCVMYINQLFINKAALRVSHHYFIEEQYVQGYLGDIPKDKITVVPNHLSSNEISAFMQKVIMNFEDAL